MSRAARTSSAVTVVCICAVVLFIAWFVAGLAMHSIRIGGFDFAAFYCAAKVLHDGHNPYLFEPLHTCEYANLPQLALPGLNRLVVPAPLPPYALVLLTPLSLIPYSAALLCWIAVQLGAIAAIAWSIARIGDLPPAKTLAMVAPVLLAVSLQSGALAVVPIAFICVAAVTLYARRYAATATLLTAAMIEPHVALPAIILTAVFQPRLRVPLVAGMALCAIVSIAFAPAALLRSYFLDALPYHAAAELANVGQYGLSPFLFRLGVAPTAAITTGALQYLLMIPLAYFFCRRLTAAGLGSWHIVVVPAALSTVGGTYIHLSQLTMCLAAALMLFAKSKPLTPLVLGFALALPIAFMEPEWALLLSMSIVALADQAYALRRSTVFALGLSAVLLFLVGHNWYSASNVRLLHPTPVTVPAASAPADTGWQPYNATRSVPPAWWFEHSAVYASLLLLLWTMGQSRRAAPALTNA